MAGWFVECAACGKMTAPYERERRVCGCCGADPRSTRQRSGDAVWSVAAVAGAVLAAPGIAVTLAGLALREMITGEHRRQP